MTSTLVPYSPPINPASFTKAAMITLVIGFLLTASFFVYEVTSNKYTRDFKKEVVAASLAAVFNGLAVVFVFLDSGLYI